jgi:hypothetical protein
MEVPFRIGDGYGLERTGARTAWSLILGWACLVTIPGPSLYAQTPGSVPPAQTGSERAKTSFGLDGTLDFGMYDEDYFLTIGLGGTFSIKKVAFGLHAPLRIRVIDREDPSIDNAEARAASGDETWYREEDWDDVSDWFRILRFFQYGNPHERVYVRLGELVAATVGHGTIVNRYYNTLDLNHYYMGLRTNLNLKGWGVEFLVNDLTYWNVLAARAYIRPLALGKKQRARILQGLGFGVTYAMDHHAPTRTLPKNLPANDPGEEAFVEPGSAAAWFIGLDMEWELVRKKMLGLTPYLDVNFFRDLGAGFHLGLLTEINAAKSQFTIRLEYRIAGAQYGPGYFNTMYDLEKWSFVEIPGARDRAGTMCRTSPRWRKLTDEDYADNCARCGSYPKYSYYDLGDDYGYLDRRHGFYGELYMNILGLVGIGGIYEDYQGPDNANVTVRADLPQIAGVKLAAYFTRRNFDGWDEFFSLENALLVAEGRWNFWGPLYAYFLYSSSWEAPANREWDDQTELVRRDNWNVGLGAGHMW